MSAPQGFSGLVSGKYVGRFVCNALSSQSGDTHFDEIRESSATVVVVDVDVDVDVAGAVEVAVSSV